MEAKMHKADFEEKRDVCGAISINKTTLVNGENI